MRDFLEVTRALSDCNRVRALLALRRRELCVCQIVELLELAPSTVSKHLSILERAQLVERRRNGRWVFYRRPRAEVPQAARAALRWVDEVLAKDPEQRDDARRLKVIVAIPLEKLCKVEGA